MSETTEPQGGRAYTEWMVARRLAEAARVRKAQRAAGDPYWTIDPWQQRPGAGDVTDGDTQGES